MSQSLAPFLLPEPLMDPAQWPKIAEAARWLIPLDVATVAGGPLKNRFEDLLMRDQAAWFLPAAFFHYDKGQNVQREIRLREAASWLKTFPGVRCYSDQPQKISPTWLKENGLPSEFISGHSATPPSLFAWAKEIFPALTNELGELKLRAELNDYLKKMPSADLFPWEELRFFAGSLRQKGMASQLSHLAAIEWAKFQALYSPQNEAAEVRGLASGLVILNPTTQIVRTNDAELLTVLFRWNDQLRVEEIGWREALLIDEASESPRVDVKKLLREVEVESAGLAKVFAKNLESERAKTFSEALSSLIEKHVLLKGL